MGSLVGTTGSRGLLFVAGREHDASRAGGRGLGCAQHRAGSGLERAHAGRIGRGPLDRQRGRVETNFSAWIEQPDGKLDVLYQSYHWLDEPTYRYDSVTMNPAPAPPEQRMDSAFSGILKTKPGTKLHFNCHIEYTDARADSEGAPKPAEIGTLHFANEAFTAEMCILFGQTTGSMLIGPSVDTSPLPAFAK